jgi:hypothetical protein
MNKHIPSFDEFLNENAMSFDEIKDKFVQNPYGIGAQSVEYVEDKRGESSRLIFRSDDKSRRDEIQKKLKTFGIPAKKMSKNTQESGYRFKYELILFENEINEAKKDVTQLATELVEIAAYYVEIDMTPEMTAARSIEDEDQLREFFDELVDTVAEDAAGPDITKFKKEAIAFLKKYGVNI